MFTAFFRNEPKTKKKKRDIKRKFKKSQQVIKTKIYGGVPPKRSGTRPLLEGVSIFELIMPWQAEKIRQTKIVKKPVVT